MHNCADFPIVVGSIADEGPEWKPENQTKAMAEAQRIKAERAALSGDHMGRFIH
jgi:hypothetical protein